ncbi:MAG: CPBP family intramembrane metalloprotease [Lachnospiraceae bacterium]|nr:CPBP family intramembrane metalloprotease [Lachnospiraceae bacterium]
MEVNEKNVSEMAPEMVSETAVDAVSTKSQRKVATAIGWRYAVFAVVVILVQTLLLNIIALVNEAFYMEHAISLNFLSIVLGVDCIGFPLLLLLGKGMEKTKIEKRKMSFGKLILSVLLMAGLAGVGTSVGTVIHLALTLPFGVEGAEANAVATLMLESGFFLRVLVVGILAPIVEELIFRKLLIDRVVKHGEFLAIALSALMFGLFHGNFSQFFMATLIGGLFAFIYIRTGKVWYTIFLHMAMNLTTSVVTVWLAGYYMDAAMELAMAKTEEQMVTAMTENILPLGAYLGWLGILGLIAFVGFILFWVFFKKFRLTDKARGIKAGSSMAAAYGNWGFVLFLLVCLFLFGMNYIPNIVMWIMSL